MTAQIQTECRRRKVATELAVNDKFILMSHRLSKKDCWRLEDFITLLRVSHQQETELAERRVLPRNVVELLRRKGGLPA